MKHAKKRKLKCSRYTEGVDILYGSNTLRIASEPLLRHMPSLLLPQRLATITSLEISWSPAITAVGDHRTQHPGHLEVLLNLLSTHLPRLSRLTLSLEMDHFVGTAPHPQDLLVPVGAFVRRMAPSLRRCAIALPRNMYMSHVALLAGPALAAYCDACSPEQANEHPIVWATLDGRFALRSYRTAEFLVPPEDMTLEDCHPDMPGFWVMEGKDDSPCMRSMPCTTEP
jgi:hypothetical protein